MQETEKAVKDEGDADTYCNLYTWNRLQRLGKETGRVAHQRKNRDNQNYSIFFISARILRRVLETWKDLFLFILLLPGVNDDKNNMKPFHTTSHLIFL